MSQLMLHDHIEHNPIGGAHLVCLLVGQRDLGVSDAPCALHRGIPYIGA